jgi:hypothetical protein
MKQYARPPRTPSNLSESFQQRLNMYALAASAAGVWILALVVQGTTLVPLAPEPHYGSG